MWRRSLRIGGHFKGFDISGINSLVSSTIGLVSLAKDISICVSISTSHLVWGEWWMNSEIYTEEQWMNG